jgi:hypothetical protein
MVGAVSATVDHAVCFHPMANNLALAMRTRRGNRMNRALKAVKNMFLAGHRDFKAFVVLVGANFTFGHFSYSFP